MSGEEFKDFLPQLQNRPHFLVWERGKDEG